LEDLKARLQARGTETEETLARRVANAEAELKAAYEHSDIFKKVIVNDQKEGFIEELDK
jgi:guanylate kinase